MKNLAAFKPRMVAIYFFAVAFTAAVFFLPAGTLDFYQAWIFMGVIFIPAFFVITYFLKRDPELLRRRMQYKEKEIQQKKIIIVADVIFFVAFLMPGFDHRYGWSDVPFWLVIVSNAIVFLSYLLCFLVFKKNSYASRIIEVQKDQKVISTGPYAVVRHPMYVAVICMMVFMPLALGSYWSLIPYLLVIPVIVLRILNEEKVLREQLKGYIEYCKKTRFRLIPHVW